MEGEDGLIVYLLEVNENSVEGINFKVGTVDGSSETDAGSFNLWGEYPIKNIFAQELPFAAGNYLIEPISEKEWLIDIDLVSKEGLGRHKRQSAGDSPCNLC